MRRPLFALVWIACLHATPAHAQDPANVDARGAAAFDAARIEAREARRSLRQTEALLRRADRLSRALAAHPDRPLSPREQAAGRALLGATGRAVQAHWDRLDPQTRARYRQAWSQAEALQRQGRQMAAQHEVRAAIDSARELLLAVLGDLRNALHASLEPRGEPPR